MTANHNPTTAAQLKSIEARRIFEAQHGSQPWMDDYFDLVGRGWSWRQAFYILWASMPKGQREPGTQLELAGLLGLESDRVIREWRAKNPALELEVRTQTRSMLGRARTEIYEALITAACKPDPRAHQDRKLALEMMGDYVPRQRLDVGVGEGDNLEEMNADDLRAQAQLPGGDE